jgi:hypothetical protein
MAEASKSGQTDPNMMECGKTTWLTDKEPYTTLMGTFMKDSGLTTKLMVTEHTATLTGQHISVSGLKISSTATASSPGLMEPDTTVSIKTAKKMEKVTLLSLTVASTPDSLKRMKFLDKASTHGQMAKYTKVNGLKTKCTVLVN